MARADHLRDSVTAPAARWLGDVTACGPFACSQEATAAVEWTALGPISVLAEGTAAQTGFAAPAALGTERRLDLSYTHQGFRMWVGRAIADDRSGLMARSSVSAGRLEYGLSARRGPFEGALSLGSGTIPIRAANSAHLVTTYIEELDSATGHFDSVATQQLVGGDSDSTVHHTPWNSAEARVSWAHSRFLLTAIFGTAAAVGRPRATWGGIQAEAMLVRGLALSVGVGSGPAVVLTATPATRGTLSAGLRITPGAFRGRESTDRPPAAAPAFVASPAGAGNMKILIRVPNAGRVDLAGDCTGWQPRGMHRLDGDRWEVIIPATPGVHHVDIRVDGGPWIAPPGLAAIDDDFMGQVGVFVAE